MAKNFSVTVNDIKALSEAHPDAVQRVVIVKEDRSRLYELAVAHFTIGKPLPGCTIIRTSDNRTLTDTQNPPGNAGDTSAEGYGVTVDNG